MTETEMREVLSSRRAAVPDAGFTLVELLIVVSIAAILASIAVPSYRSTIAKYQVATEVNGLVGDLQYARSEAIKQGMTVTMCMSSDGATCSGTNWSNGHIVLTNPTNAATPSTAGTGAVLLRAANAFSSSDTVLLAITGAGSDTAVSFNRDGFAGTPTGKWNAFSSAGIITLTVHSVTTTGIDSCVVVSAVGQVSVLANGATTPVTCS